MAHSSNTTFPPDASFQSHLSCDEEQGWDRARKTTFIIVIIDTIVIMDDRISCSLSGLQALYVASDDLELFLWSPPPECRGHTPLVQC